MGTGLVRTYLYVSYLYTPFPTSHEYTCSVHTYPMTKAGKNDDIVLWALAH